MTLDVQDLKKLALLAEQAAKKAGQCIQSWSRSALDVQTKDAGSSPNSQIVTQVDFECEKIILKELGPTLQSHNFGLLSEEQQDDGSRFSKNYFWCIDPLDGTLCFVQSKPGYSVSIALVSQKGEPQIGVIYNPLDKVLYTAIRQVGVWRNGKPWKGFQNDHSQARRIDDGGAVMNACWVLEQAPAYFVKEPKAQDGGGCLWDYAATACLFAEIGAHVSTRQGAPLDLNSQESLYMNRKGVLYASSGDIADRIFLSWRV